MSSVAQKLAELQGKTCLGYIIFVKICQKLTCPLGQVNFLDFWKFKNAHPDPIVKFYAENEYEIGFFEKWIFAFQNRISKFWNLSRSGSELSRELIEINVHMTPFSDSSRREKTIEGKITLRNVYSLKVVGVWSSAFFIAESQNALFLNKKL